jgi:hypothetical protein
MTQSQLSSMQDQKNSANAEQKRAESRRPWITPCFKPLDLSTARASGCRSANDGGSC